MIRFLKDGKYSIKMEFDLNGAKELLKLFELAYKNLSASVLLDFESSIEKGKYQKELYVVKNDLDNRIYRKSTTLILELDNPSIEYGVHKLSECINGEDFYPAEFCEVSFRETNVTIYGFFIK
jgi:hypothetical protein